MRERDRRGNAAYAAVTILALLGFGALTVDIGNARMVKAQLQVACDSGAHAGASQLDGTWSGMVAAATMAVNVANSNKVNGGSPSIGLTDLQTGEWHFDTHTFEPTLDPDDVNALKITKTIGSLPAYFGLAAFRVSSLSAGATSIAVHASASAQNATCFMPLAIPDCRFASGMSQSGIQDIAFQFTPATGDSIGWALPGTGNPNASDINTQINAPGFCGTAPATTVVSLSNGMVTDALNSLSTLVMNSSDKWDESRWGTLPGRSGSSSTGYTYDSTKLLAGSDFVNGSGAVSSKYGNIVEGPVVLFSPPSGSNYCADANGDGVPDGGSYTEDGITISGIVWGVVYDVASSGSTKNLRMKLDFTQEHQLQGSTGSFGGYDTNANGYVTVIAQ